MAGSCLRILIDSCSLFVVDAKLSVCTVVRVIWRDGQATTTHDASGLLSAVCPLFVSSPGPIYRASLIWGASATLPGKFACAPCFGYQAFPRSCFG